MLFFELEESPNLANTSPNNRIKWNYSNNYYLKKVISKEITQLNKLPIFLNVSRKQTKGKETEKKQWGIFVGREANKK